MSTTLQSFIQICDQAGLTDDEIAAAAGLSRVTVALIRARRTLPKRRDALAKVEQFVRVNAGAQSLDDLRFVPRREAPPRDLGAETRAGVSFGK